MIEECYGNDFVDQNNAVLMRGNKKISATRSSYAVLGDCTYDYQVLNITRSFKQSSRVELEITKVDLEYLKPSKLQARRHSRGFVWLDADTTLHEVYSDIKAIQ